MNNNNQVHTIHINKWYDFGYKLDPQIISNESIWECLSSFRSLVFPKIKHLIAQTVEDSADNSLGDNKFYKAQHKEERLSTVDFSLQSNNLTLKADSLSLKLAIIFKIKYINNQFKSISKLQILNLGEFHELDDIFTSYWEIRSEEYASIIPSEIVLSYKILDSNIPTKLQKYKPKEKGRTEKSKIEFIKLGGYSLPSSMDFTTWGAYHFFWDENKVLVHKKASNLEYHIELFDNYQLVELKLNDKILLTFKDTMRDKNDLSTFTRRIDNQEYFYEEGKLILKKVTKKVKFLSNIKQSFKLSKNFITMDLETRVIEEKMSVYCISIYDGKIHKTFYLSDYSNEKEMLRTSIKFLMKRKYHNYKIFLHNFSGFDAVFLLSVLTDLSDDIIPLIRDGNFINLTFRFSNVYKLHFRDSLLLLPANLRSLAKNFKVDEKGIFPYKFVNNKDIGLDYIGKIPNYESFRLKTRDNKDLISEEEYNEYSKEFINNNWNLRQETIKYCELDCRVLYKILEEFSKIIYNLFRVDILKFPTLSSLAFGIFRALFLKDSKIPLITGVMYDFIKKSYTGGSVDVYNPTLLSNLYCEEDEYTNQTTHTSFKQSGETYSSKERIYRYDVNSLYPFAMKNFPMPTGTPVYFEGDILCESLSYNCFAKNINLSDEMSPPQVKPWGEADKPFGIFEVDIECPTDIKIPILQTRVKTTNGYRTIAPTGNWSGYYFSDELYNAAKYGYKFKVKRGYLFEKGDIFSEYVDKLYDIKKNSPKDSPDYIIIKLLLNSLYGRLGMKPNSDIHIIVSNEKALDFYSKYEINNVIDFKNGKELISIYNPDIEDGKDSNNKNVSVVVSSIVTASSRIFMSKFKTDDNLKIYYTDTDSIDVNKELDPKLVGNDLGQMKLEHIFHDAVFLAPKVYGGKGLKFNNSTNTFDEYEYVRIKGLKHALTFNQLKALLHKGAIEEVKQEKWYSDISQGVFHVKEEKYRLMVTENKRQILYNDHNIFYDTRPFKLKDGEIVN